MMSLEEEFSPSFAGQFESGYRMGLISVNHNRFTARSERQESGGLAIFGGLMVFSEMKLLYFSSECRKWYTQLPGSLRLIPLRLP